MAEEEKMEIIRLDEFNSKDEIELSKRSSDDEMVGVMPKSKLDIDQNNIKLELDDIDERNNIHK